MLGILCLYILLVILSACLFDFVQTIGKIYVGPWSSFISTGDEFRYNYFMYFIGLLLFFCSLHLLYNVLLKKRLEITEVYREDKIFAVIAVIIGCVIMFVALFFEVLLLFGMTDNIIPYAMFYLTLIGWPVGTMIYLLVRLSLDM